MWLALLFACTEPGADLDSGEEASASLSGLVYAFKSRDFVAGATVGLHEFPDEVTTTDAEGNWRFDGLPIGARATPYVVADGYRDMSHRTFTLEADQERVYFQAIPTAVYNLMFAAMTNSGVELDDDACHLASTVTHPHMNEISTWDEFDAFIPHGLDETTVSVEPAIDTPAIYFNEDVFPDVNLTETTVDGGVILANMAPGIYTVTANDGAHSFDAIEITCEPGRFVNASPPQGLGAW